MSRPLLLALRALGLGDFLVAVPAYRALRRAFPDHEFRLATTAGVAPLVALVDGIDSLATARGPDDFDVPNRRPDVAVNLHGRGPQSRDALRALRPNRLISFRGVRDDDPAAPAWDDSWPGHERARWCHLLGAFGIDADPSDLALRRPGVEPGVRNAVVIHPGAAFGSRQWPAERFAAVARELRSDGHHVVITGSRAEVPLAAAVVTEAGLPRSTVMAGLTDMLSLAALIARARLVISGDTGPAHLASAYGTASVVLFGPTPPSRWGPPTDSRHVALWPSVRRTAPGDPWGAVTDPALLAIGTREVAEAARSLLDASRFSPIAITTPGLW